MLGTHRPIEYHGDDDPARCRRCTPSLARNREQLAYLERNYAEWWQQQHPAEVWGDGWTCPLCRQVVQELPSSGLRGAAEIHQRGHGEDWQQYEAIGVGEW